MLFSKNKEIQRSAKMLVRDYGWGVKKGSAHVCIYHPKSNRMLTIPGSPSCPRAAMNWHCQVRRIVRMDGGVMPKFQGAFA